MGECEWVDCSASRYQRCYTFDLFFLGGGGVAEDILNNKTKLLEEDW